MVKPEYLSKDLQIQDKTINYSSEKYLELPANPKKNCICLLCRNSEKFE
jgi:hypothetical protein